MQELIDAAQKRADESSGEEKAKAEAEVKALKDAQSAGYDKQTNLDRMASEARAEGKQSGEKAARAATLKSLGIPDDENADAELARIKEQRDGEKSDAERYRSQAETLQAEKEAEAKRAAEYEAKLRDRDRRDAVLKSLSEANYEGKTGHALGAIDASFSDKVKETDGMFDASEAVKALKEDEFPGFAPDTPSDPPRTPHSVRTPTSGDSPAEARRKRRIASLRTTPAP